METVRTIQKDFKTRPKAAFSWEPESGDFSEPGLPGETAAKRKNPLRPLFLPEHETPDF